MGLKAVGSKTNYGGCGTDPLTAIVGLPRPSASFSKLVTATGCWAVRPPGEDPIYAVLLDGVQEQTIADQAPVKLVEGDFVLLPADRDFAVTGAEPPPDGRIMEPVELSPGVFHLGPPGPPDTRS